MYLLRSAHNSSTRFLFKPKYTKSFLSILEIFSNDFAESSSNLIIWETKSLAQALHITMFSIL